MLNLRFAMTSSLLLLRRKSNQTDEGAHGYQKQLESVNASAHLRWLFARSSHMDRMPCCREYLSIDHPFQWDDLLKAFQGQSQRAGHRHSIHFSATGNEP